ncbi:MAG: HAD family hydrolase [Anaerolineaceae bacterium]|nr:HAD family hydrolase [Anaerolineaceae bacterium]
MADKKHLKAILFDLDDTLLDWGSVTQDWFEFETRFLERVRTWIESQGYTLAAETFADEFRRRNQIAWENGRSNYVAPHMGRILVEAAEVAGVPAGKLDSDACLRAMERGAIEGTAAFPDAFRVLTEIRNAGVKTAIVTNASQPMWLRDYEMEFHGLLPYFPDCRLSAADIGYLKPHPAIFEAALRCLGVTVDEAVFVGDSLSADIVGAQGVGLAAVWHKPRPMMSLLDGLVTPDATVTTLADLPAALDTLFPDWRQ